MKIPIFLVSFIAFVAFVTFKLKRQTRTQNDVNEAFLERERQANITRKKDISHLNYLSFQVSALPIGEYDDEELAACESSLTQLSDKKIINLSSYSNTDLKLMYGPANLNDLIEYDDNYHTLTTTLLAYAKRELALDRIPSAIKILEYAMSLSLDSSQIYLLLAELYHKQNMPQKVSEITKILSDMKESNESFASMTLSKLEAFRIDE